MADVTLKIDGKDITAVEGTSILNAALAADIYIPHLCAHNSVSSFKEVVLDEKVYRGENEYPGSNSGESTRDAKVKGCGLCKVKIEGRDKPGSACRRPVEDGMVVTTNDPELATIRQERLIKVFEDHPHACLLCEQKEGCSRSQCSMNVPESERCCVLLGHCELGKIADYVGYHPSLPPYRAPESKEIFEDPLFIRDYSLCIACLRCVRACREVANANVLGSVLKDEKLVVGTIKPGDMPEAECKFCGACVEICPTGALRDREGVESPADGAPLPCVNACPAGIDIPQYIRRIAEGNPAAARRVIAKSVPLPATLGYACFHPCEEHCRRSHLDKAVSICDLKRFAFEVEDADTPPPRKPDTGSRVAIIGAGPAGLATAWRLAMWGHKITLFDAAEKPGGYLRYGIPRFRLPLEALERDLAFLDHLGIEFQGKRRLGDDLDPRTLREFGYDAVVIALGTPLSKKIEVDGVDLEGVLWGIDFLRMALVDDPIRLHGNVVVVGGGSVAIDTAMTALRCGAENVEVIALESEKELPAHEDDLEAADEEGITLTLGWGPVEFTSDNGRITRAVFKKCTRVFNSQGHFSPQFADGNRIERQVDWVILAVGQTTDPSAFGPESGNVLGSTGLLSPDAESVETWLPGFFGAGDLIHGPSSIVEAIASGQRVAVAVDKFLGGDGELITEEDEEEIFAAENVSLEERNEPVHLPPEERIETLGQIHSTLDPVQAVAEANRCLRCNIRRLIKPVTLPPESWMKLDDSVLEKVPKTSGVLLKADASGEVSKIQGTENLRDQLEEWLEDVGEDDVVKVKWEEDPMYTKRESELIQQYVQEHGKMPEGDDDLDDLF